MDVYYVYAIYNKENDKYYIGQTKDLEERISLHNNKKFRASYTYRFGGTWELFYKEEFQTRGEALNREKQLKSYRGREFLKKYIPR